MECSRTCWRSSSGKWVQFIFDKEQKTDEKSAARPLQRVVIEKGVKDVDLLFDFEDRFSYEKLIQSSFRCLASPIATWTWPWTTGLSCRSICTNVNFPKYSTTREPFKPDRNPNADKVVDYWTLIQEISWNHPLTAILVSLKAFVQVSWRRPQQSNSYDYSQNWQNALKRRHYLRTQFGNLRIFLALHPNFKWNESLIARSRR